MATIQRQVLDAVVARLRAAPALVSKPTEQIRIAHRTPPTRDGTRINVVPLEDDVGNAKDCDRRTVRFEVVVIARDDGGVETIDALMQDVLQRLKPGRGDAIPYPADAVVKYGRIRFDEELADEDVAAAFMGFEATYSSSSWSLEG